MNFIFVGGLPRSGTTMVQNILDSHSGIYGGPEFDRIPNIIDLRRKLIASVATGRIKSYTDKEEIDKNISVLIQSLIGNVKTSKDLQYISEKTPWNILVFEDLIELFPDAKFIHVLRNPLDVFSSMRSVAARAKSKNRKSADFTMDVNVALNYFLAVYRLMNKISNENRSNVMTIKYENIVNDVEGQSKQLCDFLGLPWEKSLLEFNTKEHPGEKNMIGDGVWYNKEMYKQDPGKKKTSDGQNKLSGSERILMETVLSQNPYLSGNGYQIKKPSAFFQRAPAWYLTRNFLKNHYSTKTPIRILA